MKINRRSFIGLGSLAACGTALNVPLPAAVTPHPFPGAAPLCAGGEAVLAYVRSYTANFRIVNASQPGTDGRHRLHLVTELADVEHWPAAMAQVPFAKVRAGGNTLAFAIDGLDVTIENLPPEAFAHRLTLPA